MVSRLHFLQQPSLSVHLTVEAVTSTGGFPDYCSLTGRQLVTYSTQPQPKAGDVEAKPLGNQLSRL